MRKSLPNYKCDYWDPSYYVIISIDYHLSVDGYIYLTSDIIRIFILIDYLRDSLFPLLVDALSHHRCMHRNGLKSLQPHYHNLF